MTAVVAYIRIDIERPRGRARRSRPLCRELTSLGHEAGHAWDGHAVAVDRRDELAERPPSSPATSRWNGGVIIAHATARSPSSTTHRWCSANRTAPLELANTPAGRVAKLVRLEERPRSIAELRRVGHAHAAHAAHATS